MQKEIEVKFKLNKLKDIKEKLINLGSYFEKPYKQTTYSFFSKTSIEQGIFPRIRDEKGEIVLTVKVKTKKQNNYFERNEYSVKIQSLKHGKAVLKALGFNKIKTFEKVRQETEFLNTKISLDKLYFGDFIEIEGKKKHIENVINILGLNSKERITKAYLALEEEYKKDIS